MSATLDQQIELLCRRCERILSPQDLRTKLERSQKSGKPLRIKLGMDPTAPDVTLGHAVPLRVIRQFQDWGHRAVLIIGDYTARVGDPTGRNKTRPVLSGEEIDRNAQTYVSQVGKILLTDPDRLEVRYNGEWLAKMGLVDVIKLASRATVAQMLTRDDFAKRYTDGVEIRLHEILYPLLQGWDSVAIDADVEMGGSDQLFNNLVGREFQKEQGGDGQVVIVTPLLVGTDGKDKMSKSKGNYIALTDPPTGNDGMFGKVMSLPDHLMESYFQLLTDEPMEGVRAAIAANPNQAKMGLARHIVSWMHGTEAGEAAQAEWDRRRRHEAPTDMPAFAVGPGPHKWPALLVTVGLTSSNSESIRKLREGAVKIDGQKVNDFQQPLLIEQSAVLQLGRRFTRLTLT